jgi:phosphoribosylaminoimidazole carboxylase PurE protein
MVRYSVLIVAGSKSDVAVMQETQKTLDWFGVANHFVIMSAHRHPEKVRALGKQARRNGTQVIIAGAGMAAHLAGVLASYTTIPVIGIPLATEPLGALDSLLSTVQMPRGVPVAAVSAGRAGAVNAAILAVEILSIRSKPLAAKLERYRKELSSEGR